MANPHMATVVKPPEEQLATCDAIFDRPLMHNGVSYFGYHANGDGLTLREGIDAVHPDGSHKWWGLTLLHLSAQHVRHAFCEIVAPETPTNGQKKCLG